MRGWKATVSSHVHTLLARLLTELVRGRESRRQAVVLDDGAAPLGVAHGAHVRHPQRVAGRSAAQVLETREG